MGGVQCRKERELITAPRAVEINYLAGQARSKATVQSVNISINQLVLKGTFTSPWYIGPPTDGQLIARRVDCNSWNGSRMKR